jgi:RNA polymerase sigma factor (sigma-70 family)
MIIGVAMFALPSPGPDRKDSAGAPQLGDSYPSFLRLLDSDPEGAFQGFYRFTHRVMIVCPPGICRDLDPGAREDLVHDLILHCCSDDFRLLRGYQDRGRPFAAWLQLVARNKVLDEWRKRSRQKSVSLHSDDDDRPDLDLPDQGPGADEATDRRKILGMVQKALTSLSDSCRLLIQGAAEGFKPRELVRLLGLPADSNKKVSDDLRDCRRRLRGALEGLGMSETELRQQFSG